jgi:hypothetical protein
MSQLARQHAQLSAMMCFVRNEVTEEVYKVSGKVLPGGRWYCATTSRAKPDQLNHATTAACECARQFCRTNRATVNSLRHRDTVARADHLDPHASRVVKMRGEHPNCSSGSAGHSLGPQLGGQVLDEICCYAVVCAPRVDQRLGIIVDHLR